MKWKDILNHKNNTGLTLVTVMGILILLVFTHRRNLAELQDSFSSMYADRLVTTDQLYELSHMIIDKKLLLDREGENIIGKRIHMNDSILQLLTKYEDTYLTVEEKALLSSLKNQIRISRQFELQYNNLSTSSQSEELKLELSKQYDLILLELKKLTNLQLQEGQMLTNESKKIVSSDIIAFRLEIGLFIILGLLVFMMFSSAPSHHAINSPGLN